jgi:hypothetical protein
MLQTKGKVFLASAFAIVGLVAASGNLVASQHFDGRWSVRAFPNGKGCDGMYQLPVQITAGSVTYVGRGAIRAEGGIKADDSVEVSFYSEGDRLVALGMMTGKRSARGTWKSFADGCSGIWIARRT